MPVVFCDICKKKLPDCRFQLPSGVFLICQECRLRVSNQRAFDDQCPKNDWNLPRVSNQCAFDDRRPENDWNLLRIASSEESYSENVEDGYSETICRLHNQQSLIVSGLAESETDEDVLKLVNLTLFPALSIPAHFSADFVHHLGKQRQDGSPRLCKLYLNSTVARDAVLSRVRNLRGRSQTVLAGVRFRPSLTQSQLKRKQLLEDYRWNSFSKDSTGRLPVIAHYQPDGSPYL